MPNAVTMPLGARARTHLGVVYTAWECCTRHAQSMQGAGHHDGSHRVRGAHIVMPVLFEARAQELDDRLKGVSAACAGAGLAPSLSERRSCRVQPASTWPPLGGPQACGCSAFCFFSVLRLAYKCVAEAKVTAEYTPPDVMGKGCGVAGRDALGVGLLHTPCRPSRPAPRHSMPRRNQGQAARQGLCSFSQGVQRYSLFRAKSPFCFTG